ncbi:hypothetical protein [Cellulosilyticum ruminicola]|uniref:hypothetical protein n=1 Tax=Cellulosilyticum ruminicola TaxID=425254 RepID=UPI0006D21A35|nr:hypothetical protein [Cellulosilyticum ruminicola]
MNIYDQLLKLQVIEGAWEKWADYRSGVTEYIVVHCENKKEIALFGAGRCNDVDLKTLLAHFEKVILVDMDLEAMKAGIKYQGLQNESRIILEVADFVGISSDDYRQFADILVSKVREKGLATSLSELSQVALDALERLEAKIISVPLQFKLYANTVVIGIHSQLISMLDWIWQSILQTLGQEENSVRQRIMMMNTDVVKRFNQALLIGTQCRLIIGYEIERVGRHGAVQGAVQGVIDFKQRVARQEVDLLGFTQMEWPFAKQQGIIYHMGIFTLERI